MIDEFTREALAILVPRKNKSPDIIDMLAGSFFLRGVPALILSDNGPEFVDLAPREWITSVCPKTVYIELGSLWENGYC